VYYEQKNRNWKGRFRSYLTSVTMLGLIFLRNFCLGNGYCFEHSTDHHMHPNSPKSKTKTGLGCVKPEWIDLCPINWPIWARGLWQKATELVVRNVGLGLQFFDLTRIKPGWYHGLFEIQVVQIFRWIRILYKDYIIYRAMLLTILFHNSDSLN
jgi:hypothetical protein